MVDVPKTSARLLALLSLLQTRRDWSGVLLAERLEVSPRTVRRDVDRLRELGYPIATTKGPDGGYRLAAGTELPPLLFDDEQAVALAVALQTSGVGEAALRALNTIRQVMPSRLRHRVDAMRVTPIGTPEVDPQLLMTLSAAVHAHEVLRFDYNSERRRAGLTTWSRGVGAGTWSRGTWSVLTGGRSGWTGSRRVHPPGRGSPRATSGTWPRS
ncbi:hypothetical protein GCM10029964_000050 [Kibdelosporangium lantanae]